MANNDQTVDHSDAAIECKSRVGPRLQDLIGQPYSRRHALSSGGATAAVALLGGSLLAACDGAKRNTTQPIANTPPVAGITSTGATTGGRVVTLTGTVTASNAIVSQMFQQKFGPTIPNFPLKDTATATFIAPAVQTTSELGFTYIVTDSRGLQSSADVVVTLSPPTLGFTAVAKSLADTLVVPSGYTATVVYRLGDPLTSTTAAFLNNGTDTGFEARAGDHHGGMSYFGLAASGGAPDASNSSRGLLVMGHQNISRQYLHPTGGTSVNGVRPTDEVVKEMECHGVSVVEVTRASVGAWNYVQGSPLNRRITPYTSVRFSGPAKGNPLLFTAYSPDGTIGRGTISNRAGGRMPWGTYMTCEDDWAGYFRRDAGDDARRNAALGAKSVYAFSRYGLDTGSGDAFRGGNYDWTTASEQASGQTLIRKFNATTNPAQPTNGTGDFRNEPNQYGWCVEFDPYDPASIPRKRTALGVAACNDGRPGARL